MNTSVEAVKPCTNALLPTVPVAIALAAWVAFITPKFRWLGRQFQDASGSGA